MDRQQEIERALVKLDGEFQGRWDRAAHYATGWRGAEPVLVTVTRAGLYGFYAATKVGELIHSSYANQPSDAYRRLMAEVGGQNA